jgi:hexokinase
MISSSLVIAEAKRIAVEFDYPAAEVNRAVKEFMDEMEEGLVTQGATLNQIPSYVTAVPDGTEKVRMPPICSDQKLSHSMFGE